MNSVQSLAVQQGASVKLAVPTTRAARSNSCGPPSHAVLEKDGTLEEKVQELAEDTEALREEFDHLEKFIKRTVNKKTSVANLEENQPLNVDPRIGEQLLATSPPVAYDDNYLRVRLGSGLASSYINASRVRFPGDRPQVTRHILSLLLL